jgi:hypothetical protein
VQAARLRVDASGDRIGTFGLIELIGEVFAFFHH